MKIGLKVGHHGHAKIVGIVFTLHPSGETIFYHAGTASQFHPKYDCPGGLDECVLAHLIRLKVEKIHHWIKPEGPLYRTTVEDVIQFGIEEHSDGRDRIYLPGPLWKQQRQRLYTVPWISDNAWLTLEPGRMGVAP